MESETKTSVEPVQVEDLALKPGQRPPTPPRFRGCFGRKLGFNYQYPEYYYDGLLTPEERDKVKSDERAMNLDMKLWRREKTGFRRIVNESDKELCYNCGLTAGQLTSSGYCSRIRVQHTTRNEALWSLGYDWLIQDQPNDLGQGNDYITNQFLKQQPNSIIPIPEQIRITKDTDPVHFTIISRIHGVPLSTIYPSLNPTQVSKLQDQMVEILKELRSYTSPYIQKVDGSLLDDRFSYRECQSQRPICFKMGRTTKKWAEKLEAYINDPNNGWRDRYSGKNLVLATAHREERLPKMKSLFVHDDGPYVLTHGDLNLSNILVKDDRIVGLIDWEFGGYYPWWAEQFIVQRYTGGLAFEFFEPIWPKLTSLDWPTYYDKVVEPIEALQKIMKAYGGPLTHKARTTKFYRRKFCDCQPYGGAITYGDLGFNLIDDHARTYLEGLEEEVSKVQIAEGKST